MTSIRHQQLIHSLKQFDAPCEIAQELARDGVTEALPAILSAIIRDCGWEFIPDGKIEAYVTLATAECFPQLLHTLESLDEAELESDSGDISDEFWRIQTAIGRILVGIGPPIVATIRESLTRTKNTFARETLADALEEIGE